MFGPGNVIGGMEYELNILQSPELRLVFRMTCLIGTGQRRMSVRLGSEISRKLPGASRKGSKGEKARRGGRAAMGGRPRRGLGNNFGGHRAGQAKIQGNPHLKRSKRVLVRGASQKHTGSQTRTQFEHPRSHKSPQA